MKVGIIGPPQSGKSTLYTAITGQKLDPAHLVAEHTAIVKVPDERVDHLAKVYQPKKTTHTTIEVGDFPGISSADVHGREHLKKLLPNIRNCDLLVAVLRDFRNDAVPAHRDRINAAADLAALHDDFIFADLEQVTNRLDKLEKSLKKPSKTQDQEKREQALLQRCLQALEQLQPLSTVLQHPDDALLLRSFAFLTEKPLLIVVNVSESAIASAPTLQHPHAHTILNLCASAEAEIAQLDEADRIAFLADLGISQPARDRLIQICYQALGLISFLTYGEDEVRAWTIRQGSDAVEAAGRIHSDIARGFIRAETVAYADFLAAGNDLKQVKAAGKLRQEGKTYTMRDGDMVHFKFNV
ncbi:MAG: Ribosome-binding ATPase YchF [Phycisphaerae bacterium]|nr:Ribosome-binding ATPase YchF [Phycisphaerae bacterium]